MRGFSSGWVEISKEIDGVAGCFYLGACTQGKGRRLTSKTKSQSKQKGFGGFL